MEIDTKTWAELRDAAAADDQELFEHRVETIVEAAVRNQLAARAGGNRRPFLRNGKPYLVTER